MTTILDIERKIAPILPQGKKSLQDLVKEALFLKLQEVNRKIAAFEGKYNQGFADFKRQWGKQKTSRRFSYEIESDYMDWEALETYKRDLKSI